MLSWPCFYAVDMQFARNKQVQLSAHARFLLAHKHEHKHKRKHKNLRQVKTKIDSCLRI